MMALPPVLLLGADTPIALSVIRELGQHGVPVHAIGRDVRAIGGASRWLAGFSTRDPARPLGEWLPERIRATGAKALFAITEGDLLALAGLEPEIEGCRILTPRLPQLSLVLDKSRTLEAALSVGIDTPQSWQPLATDDFAATAASLAYPVIAKWADPPAMVVALDAAGLALIKAETLPDAAALRAMLDRYAPLKAWPLVQQFCPGHGLGQMLHMAGGRVTLRFQHQRLHEWPVEGGVSTLCESLPPGAFPEQMAKSGALLAAIGWEGPAMVEYRHDPATGQFWLMEINGRFWGSLPLARHCGAHFAWAQYCAFVLSADPPIAPTAKHRRARFMVPETRHLLHILRHGGGAGRLRTLWRYVAGFADPRMRYYVFSWNDPGPMIRDFANIIRSALRRGKAAPSP